MTTLAVQGAGQKPVAPGQPGDGPEDRRADPPQEGLSSSGRSRTARRRWSRSAGTARSTDSSRSARDDELISQRTRRDVSRVHRRQGLGHGRDLPRQRRARQHLLAARSAARLALQVPPPAVLPSLRGRDRAARPGPVGRRRGLADDSRGGATSASVASAASRSTCRGSGAPQRVWDDAADHQGDGNRGTVDLAGDAAVDVPSARLHWWILPTGTGTDVSSRTASGGSIAVLYQNELHDWRTGSQANAFFARLGMLFGKPRIAFVLEPLGTTISVRLRARARSRRRQAGLRERRLAHVV